MSRNLFIPPLGTEITLAEDWTFDLFREYRNDTLIDTLGVEFPGPDSVHRYSQQSQSITLPAGSVLKVDRIYIKKGQIGYDSVTFYLKGHNRPGYLSSYRHSGKMFRVPAKPVRFWAKLEDANKIVMEEL